jgi:hypothetical protein
MIPLIGLHLHDHHIAFLRRAVELPESALIPAILIEVVRVVVFPPGIIDPVIVELDTMGLPEIAHYQPPAVEVAKHKRTLQQWQFPARLNGA